METQLHRPQDSGLPLGEGHGQAHDEGEQHHQKKSVLKKVKAKAKKIKDTLKHGLSHEHEHQQLQGEHGVDEEEEEGTDDEEMEEDPEVHGGQPYAIRSKDVPKEDILSNLQNPASQKEDRCDTTKMKNEDVHRPSLQRQDEFARPPSVPETKDTDHATGHGKQEHDQGLLGHGRPAGLEPYPPHYRGEMHHPRSAMEKYRAEEIDREITGLEPNPTHSRREDEHRTPSPAEIYASKGIDQVTGQGKSEVQEHKIGALPGIEEDPHAPKDPMANPNGSNYQSKVTDLTGRNNEEAGVSPLVRSLEKMGVDDAPEATANQGAWQLGAGGGTGDTKIGLGTEHIDSTGSHDQFAPKKATTDFPSAPEDTESLPKSMDRSKPEDSSQDTLTGKPASYTEKISIATSAISDKALAAKNVVASKLGYGGTEEKSNKPQESGDAKDTAKTTSSATEFAQKAATTVAEKLAPVYEKVAGAGSTVMAKVTGHENKTEHAKGNLDATDKGVSMKEYLAEKFKPGEEDKALSEVIQDSLSRQKEKTQETGETKPMGKVTESEELERKLGPIEDIKKDDNGGSGETRNEGFRQGVVDSLRGVVNTWLGKGGEVQSSPGTTKDSAAEGGAAVGKAT